MQRILYSQKFKEENKDEYLKLHRDFSSAWLKAFKDAGVNQLVSWYIGTTTYLYWEVEDFDAAVAKLGEDERFKELLEQVTPMLDVVADYSGDSEIKLFEKFFDLNEQLKAKRNRIE